MRSNEPVIVPANLVNEESDQGHLSAFEPGVRTLPAGLGVDDRFLLLPVDIVLEKDVAITVRDGVTIFADVFRPAGSEAVPVIGSDDMDIPAAGEARRRGMTRAWRGRCLPFVGWRVAAPRRAMAPGRT